jgi:hypothetical protein
MVSGISLFVVALGAILTWAVNVSLPGVDGRMVGIILMVVGVLSALSSLVFWNGPLSRTRRAVAGDSPTTIRQTTTVEEERYPGT